MAPDVDNLLQHGGRDRAFSAIVDYYQAKVFRFVYSLLFNAATAEDVTQDVFMIVWRTLDSYNPRMPFAPWLYTIARNAALNKLRREACRRTTVLDPAAEPAAARSADSVEIAEVRRMVEKLPPEQKEAVVLFYLQERSLEEAALMLDVPQGTLKSQLFRARKALAAMLGVKR